MHLDLQNYIVGLGSFWNLVLPAIAVIAFLVGMLAFAVSRRSKGLQPGLLVAGIGVVLFVVAAVGDEVGNAHDVTALESAVHDRYGLSIDYADAAALFGSTAGVRSSLGDSTVTAFGSTDLHVGGTTETVSLDRVGDGSYVLSAEGKEIASR